MIVDPKTTVLGVVLSLCIPLQAALGDVPGRRHNSLTIVQNDEQNASKRALSHLDEAKKHLAAGNEAAAIEESSLAIQSAPRLPTAYGLRAQIYMMRGGFQQAVEDLQVAVRLAPDEPGFYLMRGNALFFLERFEPAVRDLTQAIKLRPKNSVAHFLRGRAYGLWAVESTKSKFEDVSGRFDSAIVDMKRAIELSSDGGVDPAYVKEYLKGIEADRYFVDPR